jgi:hypothetical protein
MALGDIESFPGPTNYVDLGADPRLSSYLSDADLHLVNAFNECCASYLPFPSCEVTVCVVCGKDMQPGVKLCGLAQEVVQIVGRVSLHERIEARRVQQGLDRAGDMRLDDV